MKHFKYFAGIVLASLVLAPVGWYIAVGMHQTTVPFVYKPNSLYPLTIETRVAGRPIRLSLQPEYQLSLLMTTQDAVKPLALTGHDQVLETSLGNYLTTNYFQTPDSDPAMSARRFNADGQLGSDFMEGSKHSPRLRWILDFKKTTLTIDWNSSRPRLSPPSGTISLPMHQDAQDQLVVTLAVNDTESVDFVVSGHRDMVVPLRILRLTDAQANRRVPPSIPLMVTLDIGGIKVRANAVTYPHFPGTAELGLGLLSKYRVIIDYRDKMLYLEPPK